MLRSCRKEYAAETNPSRLKDEPRKGFFSVLFFVGKAISNRIFGRAVKGLFQRTIFQIEASKRKPNDNLTEWLTTIEQITNS